MDDGPPEDNFNSPLGSTDGFYEGMERINAVSLSLGLRLGEFIMRDCWPAGRWTSKVLEAYTRSTSWLRWVLSRSWNSFLQLGGIHSRLMGDPHLYEVSSEDHSQILRVSGWCQQCLWGVQIISGVHSVLVVIMSKRYFDKDIGGRYWDWSATMLI